jgi:FAD/FMN-containing dehydrogenase
MADLIEKLCEIVGASQVLTGAEISARNTSYWDASPMRGRALVRPASTAQVSDILRTCNDAGQPVTIISGNTGGVQGQHPRPEEVIISMERMNAIEDIDTIGGTATVQAGCILETLQNAVAERDMLFPLDLGGRGSCAIGGNVATNAGGLSVIRYGMMRDLTLGVEAVLADGTVLSSMNQLIKNNTGYDLKQLFIGSEGTLGVVTRVVVKLVEAPLSVNTALLALESFEQVTGLLKHLKKTAGSLLTSFEYMANSYYQAVTGPGGNRAPLARDYPCYVVAEVQGTHPEQDSAMFENILEQAMTEGLVCDAIIAQSQRERDDIWTVRENFEPLLEEKPFFLYDVSLPIRAMDEYQREVKSKIKSLWPQSDCHALAHVGDNNLHWFIVPRDPDPQAHEKATQIVYEPLQALHGSISAEHGIGLEKKPYLGLTRSVQELDTMRLLKRSLDPNDILGRGRIFDL